MFYVLVLFRIIAVDMYKYETCHTERVFPHSSRIALEKNLFTANRLVLFERGYLSVVDWPGRFLSCSEWTTSTLQYRE